MNQLITIEPGPLAALNRSEMDGQIAIARAYPRSVERFEESALALATRDPEVAAECIYTLPRDGKMVEGPSARLAEILVSQWGNCRVGARVIEEASDHIVAQGFFLDLESNAITTFETRRRIVDRKGKRYSPDMINTTCNAACSIAHRQAVLKGITKPRWQPIFEAAKRRAIGDAPLPELRKQALKAFSSYGVDEARVLKALGVASVDEIGREEIARLRGVFTALKDGEVTVAEAFPTEPAPAKSGEAIRTLDDFAQSGGATKPETGAQTSTGLEGERGPDDRGIDEPGEPAPTAEASPGPSPPVEESAADAYGVGMEIRRKGGKRDQYPARFHNLPHLVEAFQAGWDEKNSEIKNEVTKGR